MSDRRAKKKTTRKRLYLNNYESIPDVSSAITMLDCLGSEHDPVWIKLDNGKWLELENGLYEYECGGRMHFDTPHDGCPSCTCKFDMDFSGPSHKFMIRFYGLKDGCQTMREGSLLDMILDRLGITT